MCQAKFFRPRCPYCTVHGIHMADRLYGIHMADILIWYKNGWYPNMVYMVCSCPRVIWPALCPWKPVLSLSLGLRPQHFHCFIQALAFFKECNSVTFSLTGIYISPMDQIKLTPSGPMWRSQCGTTTRVKQTLHCNIPHKEWAGTKIFRALNNGGAKGLLWGTGVGYIHNMTAVLPWQQKRNWDSPHVCRSSDWIKRNYFRSCRYGTGRRWYQLQGADVWRCSAYTTTSHHVHLTTHTQPHLVWSNITRHT